MRKTLTVGLAGVLVLALAAVAFAVQSNQATIKFSSTKAGSSTGVTSTFDITDPDNHVAGEDGKPTRQIGKVEIIFPAGTKINYKKFPKCAATAGATFKSLCKKSKLASGSTTIDGRNTLLGGKVPGVLTAYNTSTGLAILIQSKNPAVNNQVLRPSWKGTRLVTDLRGTPLKDIDAFLSRFKLVIPKKVLGKGKKAVKYMTLPKKCPAAKQWKIKTKFTFIKESPAGSRNWVADGSTTTPGTVNKCKK